MGKTNLGKLVYCSSTQSRVTTTPNFKIPPSHLSLLPVPSINCWILQLFFTNSTCEGAWGLWSVFSPFLNTWFQRYYHCHGWAQPWPFVGPSWSHMFAGHGQSFWQLLTAATCEAPLLFKPSCHANPMHFHGPCALYSKRKKSTSEYKRWFPVS